MKERMWIWLAWKLPSQLVYWCAMRVGARATTGEYSDQVVPDLRYTDALKRWEADHD